jgi:uncharacterized protein YxeA
MVQIILFIFIIALAIFLYLKNKQENRSIDRHNRLLEKQEELMKNLRTKNEQEENDNQ